MCSISVEPIPSRIGFPVASSQRDWTAAGRASAAETHARTDEKSLAPTPAFKSAAYRAGTLKNSVGRWVATVAQIGSGAGRPAISTLVAPAHNGNESPLPSPYAWKSFVVEKHTSRSVIRRTLRA